MCGSGAWKNFDEIEEELTVDELFLLYEACIERQKRLIETVGAAMGATPQSSSKPESEKQAVMGPILAGGEAVVDGKEVVAPQVTSLIGYRTRPASRENEG